jgi:hypothetical protein
MLYKLTRQRQDTEYISQEREIVSTGHEMDRTSACTKVQILT